MFEWKKESEFNWTCLAKNENQLKVRKICDFYYLDVIYNVTKTVVGGRANTLGKAKKLAESKSQNY